jgi:hypothetical protein
LLQDAIAQSDLHQLMSEKLASCICCWPRMTMDLMES